MDVKIWAKRVPLGMWPDGSLRSAERLLPAMMPVFAGNQRPIMLMKLYVALSAG